MKAKIESRFNQLLQYGIGKPDELLRYLEPHRYFHTWEHIEAVSLAVSMRMYNKKGPAIMDPNIYIATLFHDVIYDPTRTDNEEKSAELVRSIYSKKLDKSNGAVDIDLICEMILSTNHGSLKDIGKESDECEILCSADLSGLWEDEDIGAIMKSEYQIFKEYQFVDYKIFKEKRIEVLKSFHADRLRIKYVENWKPNIAVYAGSFNPLHRGHLNIAEKAEKIFDKVIFAQGHNPVKNAPSLLLGPTLKYHQKEVYLGLLTDFIKGLDYPVTVIRGLRDEYDLHYESNQYRYMQELLPGIKVVNILCDKEFSHISSSDLRLLRNYESGLNAKYEVI